MPRSYSRGPRKDVKPGGSDRPRQIDGGRLSARRSTSLRLSRHARARSGLVLRSAGGKAPLVTVGDLGRDQDANAVADAVLAGLGGVDILVNNVGAVLRMDNPS